MVHDLVAVHHDFVDYLTGNCNYLTRDLATDLVDFDNPTDLNYFDGPVDDSDQTDSRDDSDDSTKSDNPFASSRWSAANCNVPRMIPNCIHSDNLKPKIHFINKLLKINVSYYCTLNILYSTKIHFYFKTLKHENQRLRF